MTTGGTVLVLDAHTFDETVNEADTPVLVDFWAEWCGPCRAMTPVLDEIAREWAGKLIVAKINVDDHPDIAGRHNVRSIPTLLVFDQGTLVKTIVGAGSKIRLTAELDDVLA
jgi:thioredoxin 1